MSSYKIACVSQFPSDVVTIIHSLQRSELIKNLAALGACAPSGILSFQVAFQFSSSFHVFKWLSSFQVGYKIMGFLHYGLASRSFFLGKASGWQHLRWNWWLRCANYNWGETKQVNHTYFLSLFFLLYPYYFQFILFYSFSSNTNRRNIARMKKKSHRWNLYLL